MSYQIEVENRAARQIEDLPAYISERVYTCLVRLGENPRPRGCTRLKGRREPLWRVRVGDYRVLYRVNDEARLVRVLAVSRRDEAYR